MTDEEKKFLDLVSERESIFVKKSLLKTLAPFTDDPVLATYKFCNVHRCLDKTYFLIQSLNLSNKALIGLLRWSSSFSLLSYLKSNPLAQKLLKKADKGNPNAFIQFLFENSRPENKKFNLATGSFIVNRRQKDDLHQMQKIYSQVKLVWSKVLSGDITSTQAAVSALKSKEAAIGDFTAYCIVSDWIYSDPDKFSDLLTWTSYGPGAFRGLKDVYPDLKVSSKNYVPLIKELREIWNENSEYILKTIENSTGISREQISHLCKQEGCQDLILLVSHPLMLDVEHWLCEFHKYKRGYCRQKFTNNF